MHKKKINVKTKIAKWMFRILEVNLFKEMRTNFHKEKGFNHRIKVTLVYDSL